MGVERADVLERIYEEEESGGIDFGEFARDLFDNPEPMFDENWEIIPIRAVEVEK